MNCMSANDKYALHNDEKETHLLFNYADGYWDISTSIPSHMAKFEKLGYELTHDNGYEKTFKAPKKAIIFRDVNKLANRKPMTEEQKAAAQERLARIREKRQIALGA